MGPYHVPFIVFNVRNIARENVVKEKNKYVYRIDHHDGPPSIFVCFVQLCFEKAVISLKSTMLVSYPVHINLFDSAGKYRRWVIKNWLSLIDFLPAQLDTTIEGGTDSVQTEFRTILGNMV